MARNIKTETIDVAIGRVLNGEYHRFPGITRGVIAKRTGIPPVTVQRLFTGGSAWSMSQFLEVVAAIGTERSPESLFREAIDLAEKIDQSASDDNANVTHISGKKGDEWQGEERAVQEWDAVAKPSKGVIEINPDDHTP